MIRSPQLSLCQRNEKWIFILFNRAGEIPAYLTHTHNTILYELRSRARFLFINFEVSVLLDWMSFVCSFFLCFCCCCRCFFFSFPQDFSFFPLSICSPFSFLSFSLYLSHILVVSTIYFVLIQPYRAHKLHIISVSLFFIFSMYADFFFCNITYTYF